ncbi:hypothetical protein CLPUN_12150 [Clostridium puniceum]|uniref:Uncharacterized protein n=1 Tax=Clostridium puniceum TaxID=29367 RepID=A0A1S8TUJ8_9CLOT|nr:hypothetical protein [Clostridium puniceum]OOM81055.1 hypothetical protein CLPUN_12150 [Clostridium puniceum]
MDNFTKEMIKKAERMGYEMKGLAQEMTNEILDMRDFVKEKVERLGEEIKKRLIR